MLICFLCHIIDHDKLYLHGECQISGTYNMAAMSPKYPYFNNSCIKVNLTIKWKVPCPMLLPHTISLVRAYLDATLNDLEPILLVQ